MDSPAVLMMSCNVTSRRGHCWRWQMDGVSHWLVLTLSLLSTSSTYRGVYCRSFGPIVTDSRTEVTPSAICVSSIQWNVSLYYSKTAQPSSLAAGSGDGNSQVRQWVVWPCWINDNDLCVLDCRYPAHCGVCGHDCRLHWHPIFSIIWLCWVKWLHTFLIHKL